MSPQPTPALTSPSPSPQRPLHWLPFELRLLGRSRLSVFTLLLLLALTSLAVVSGLHTVHQQHTQLADLAALHAQDRAAITARYPASPDAGYPAYYTFHATWNPPSEAAFLALGLRDVAPYVHRIRALGLQAQIYDGEVFNPELALTGRFDVAFVLVYLVPLFVIALLHDLVAGERQAGRLGLLLSLPARPGALWQRRAGLRLGLLLACLTLPVLVGAAVAGTTLTTVALVLLASAGYVAFWGGLALLVAARVRHAVAGATLLVTLWAALTLVLPTVANLVLTRAVPVPQGVDLMLAQRENVHGAWEQSRPETLQRFLAHYPQWQDTAPLPEVFHWKWYFAFHHLGDLSVAESAAGYEAGLLARQQATERLGWVLPGVGVQNLLHRLAHTDLPAQLAYQQEITAFHETVRRFYYAYLFNDRPFGESDFAQLPVFEPAPQATLGTGFTAGLGLVLALGLGLLALGGRQLRRIGLH